MWDNAKNGFVRRGGNSDCYGKAYLIQDKSGLWFLKIYDNSHLIMQVRFPNSATETELKQKANDYLDDFILFKDDEDDKFSM